jgi:thymidylate synthase (FAD)
MKVELLKYTQGGIELIAKSARVSGVQGLKDREIVRMMVENDYSSVLEHISFTFDISGISIALSRELLEHRIASHTARSTRYQEEKFEYYTPKEIEKNEKIKEYYDAVMKELAKVYQDLKRMGISRESRRYVLPLSTHTHYIWTINARSLINFLGLRLCVRAAPEIKMLAEKIYRIVVGIYPDIFKGVGCRGRNLSVCPENEVRDSQGKDCPFKYIPTMKEVKSQWSGQH